MFEKVLCYAPDSLELGRTDWKVDKLVSGSAVLLSPPELGLQWTCEQAKALSPSRDEARS